MVKLIQSRKNLVLYLPESFEWIILKSGILAGDKKIDTILESPQNYVESSKYFSWERYFTTLLVEETKDSYLRYSKKKLNPVYLQKNIQAKICGTMVGIKLTE